MRKRRQLLILLASVAALLALLGLLPREREPHYNGRSLSEWLSLYAQASGPTRSTAEDAVRHIGTNALPWLLQDVAYERPQWRKKLARATPNRFDWATGWIPPNHDGTSRAILGFTILGTNAAPAIPVLARLMNNPTVNVSSKRAIYALWAIGDPALPVLAAALRDPKTPNRDSIPTAISVRPPQHITTNLWVPPLVAALTDPDRWVRWGATNALLAIAPEALTNSATQ